MSRRSDRKVSFDDEPLIIVNEADEVIGHLPKAAVHEGEGILHRAFSVFLLNSQGELLMQQRAATKPLWPLFWSNACCSHPRRGEEVAEATVRRLEEELGVQAEPEYVYTFTYHARFGELGSERERCSVFLARSDDPVMANASEIAALRWMTPEALDWDLRVQPDSYTPWLKLEWARVRTQLIGRCAPTHPGPD